MYLYKTYQKKKKKMYCIEREEKNRCSTLRVYIIIYTIPTSLCTKNRMMGSASFFLKIVK